MRADYETRLWASEEIIGWIDRGGFVPVSASPREIFLNQIAIESSRRMDGQDWRADVVVGSRQRKRKVG